MKTQGLVVRFGARAAVRWALGGVLGVLTALPAAYLESDRGGTAVPAMRPPTPELPVRPMPPPNEPGAPILRLLNSLQVGEPWRQQGLTVFPLHLAYGADASGVCTLDDALRHGWLAVRELESPDVGTLWVRNDGKQPVLLLAGEILCGGRQNRSVRRDILLPVAAGFIPVPVVCVEERRWTGPGDRFERSPGLLQPRLRDELPGAAAQQGVWREAAKSTGALGLAPATGDYGCVYEDSSVRRRLDDLCDAFRRGWRRDVVGVVVAVGPRVVGCDLFADPSLFAQLWPKLCRSYAVESLSCREGPAGGVTRDEVGRFLDGVRGARFGVEPTAGAGEAVRIEGSTSGEALVWRGAVVHMALRPTLKWLPPMLRDRE